MKVIVVGGGIGGLAAAVGLRQAGHSVTVFERSAFSREIGAAINVCPNASRILLQWGFDPQRSRMVTVRQQRVALGSTLKTVAQVDCSGFAQTYGAPFYFAHRVDLHNELRSMATQQNPPVEIVLKAEVVKYDPDQGSVTLKDGSVHSADLIVAADGVHSIAVSQVYEAVAPAVPTGQVAFRFLIPTEELRTSPSTASLLEEGVMKILTGSEGRRLVWYPCADNTLQNFVGIHPSEEEHGNEAEDWDYKTTVEDAIAQYQDFNPVVLEIIKKAPSINRWPLLYREPIPTWTRGRLVLIGDAAHPMLPHQGQGGAQAIEDAGALHVVFADLRDGFTPEDIQARLRLFEAVRLNRASAIQVFSNAGQDEAHKVRERAQQFMPKGVPIPTSPAEYVDHNFRHDVIEESRSQMKEYLAAAQPSSV